MRFSAILLCLFAMAQVYSENLILYYTDYCPYSQKVLAYLKEIHRTVPMKNVDNNPEYKAELLQAGGKLQVPCLIVDGQAIYSSGAIIDWFSAHPEDLTETKF